MQDKFWSSEKILSLSALVVSLSTLVVFVYQTNLIRKQQYMSVYPHLLLSNSRSGSVEYQYLLSNQGIGPAMIKSVDVSDLNGKSYESITDFIATQFEETDTIWVYNSDVNPGRLVPAEEKIVLYGLYSDEECNSLGLPNNTVRGANKFREALNHDSLIVKITYESIYGESWSIYNNSKPPVKN